MCVLYGAILSDQSISLRAISAKDGSTVERQIKSFGEPKVWVSKEADLAIVNIDLFK